MQHLNSSRLEEWRSHSWSLHRAMLPSAVTLASKETCLECDLLALHSPVSPRVCAGPSISSTKHSPTLLFTLVISDREAAA